MSEQIPAPQQQQEITWQYVSELTPASYEKLSAAQKRAIVGFLSDNERRNPGTVATTRKRLLPFA